MPLMNHNSFILTSISDMLVDVTSATLGAGDGVETYPLCDYVMQSVFLKMTGALEQKMKCISWEMATNDYEYRYMRYSKNPLGECSSYQEKNDIYKDLVKQIQLRRRAEYCPSSIDRLGVLNKTTSQVKNTFIGTNLLIWAQKSFNEYIEIWGGLSERYFLENRNNLFTKRANLPPIGSGRKSLDEIYNDHLYKHRNRVAHNTFSYQQNLSTLSTLVNEYYKYNNYFVYFSILVLIDNVFIRLFDEYLCSIQEF